MSKWHNTRWGQGEFKYKKYTPQRPLKSGAKVPPDQMPQSYFLEFGRKRNPRKKPLSYAVGSRPAVQVLSPFGFNEESSKSSKLGIPRGDLKHFKNNKARNPTGLKRKGERETLEVKGIRLPHRLVHAIMVFAVLATFLSSCGFPNSKSESPVPKVVELVPATSVPLYDGGRESYPHVAVDVPTPEIAMAQKEEPNGGISFNGAEQSSDSGLTPMPTDTTQSNVPADTGGIQESKPTLEPSVPENGSNDIADTLEGIGKFLTGGLNKTAEHLREMKEFAEALKQFSDLFIEVEPKDKGKPIINVVTFLDVTTFSDGSIGVSTVNNVGMKTDLGFYVEPGKGLIGHTDGIFVVKLNDKDRPFSVQVLSRDKGGDEKPGVKWVIASGVGKAPQTRVIPGHASTMLWPFNQTGEGKQGVYAIGALALSPFESYLDSRGGYSIPLPEHYNVLVIDPKVTGKVVEAVLSPFIRDNGELVLPDDFPYVGGKRFNNGQDFVNFLRNYKRESVGAKAREHVAKEIIDALLQYYKKHPGQALKSIIKTLKMLHRAWGQDIQSYAITLVNHPYNDGKQHYYPVVQSVTQNKLFWPGPMESAKMVFRTLFGGGK